MNWSDNLTNKTSTVYSYNEKYLPFGERLGVFRWTLILILGTTNPDFWTYRMLSRLGKLMHAPALCVKEFALSLQNRQLAS